MSAGQGGTKGADRPALLHALRHTPEDVARKAGAIHRELIAATSGAPQAGGVAGLLLADFPRLFGQYDTGFFGGLLGRMLAEDGAGPVGFRVSGRMTRAAGKTFVRRPRARAGGPPPRPTYEIAVSLPILLATFRDQPGRVVSVGGLPCRDWQEAVLRIFEHELLHLAEFLGWGDSSCARENFQRLSRQIFGHVSRHHELITPREEAATRHGVRVGARVSFEFEGARRVGRVNRITRRATVLVEDPKGQPYSDGRRYLTFYIPLPLLTPESE